MLNKSLKISLYRPEWLICIALIAATLFVYGQVRNHEFVIYDDKKYIYENPHLQNGLTWKSIQWAFSADLVSDSPNADFWIPLTFLSHMLTIELFGMDASMHHMVNLLFHLLNTLLLFVVLHRMTGGMWQSAFVAALFAIHPLHVESVAWVTERKDVLSTFFWFLTMWAYLQYTIKPSLYRYLLVTLAFVLGLMAKPMLITLPFVLLLLDYWPLNRLQFTNRKVIGNLVWEKIPLFLLGITSITITLMALQGGGHVMSLESYSLWTRLGNALVAYVSYIGKMFWPHNLAVLYPHPGNTLPLWEVTGSGLLLIGLSIFVFRFTPRHPYLGMGWLWYLGTLFPVIGLVQAGLQAMADRYTYVPLIGLFIIITWGISNLASKWKIPRTTLSIFAVISLVILMVFTWFQVHHWQNSTTLFEHAIQVTRNNYVAHLNLGTAYQLQGHRNEAIREFQETVRIKPYFFSARIALGSAFESKGNLDEAIREYQAANILDPNDFISRFLLGTAYEKKGHLDEAIREYQRAVSINPDSPMTNFKLGNSYYKRGDFHEALQEYQKVLVLNPNFFMAHHKLGDIYLQWGDFDAAMREYQQTLSLNPKLERTHNKLGVVYKKKGQWDKAIHEFKTAIKLNPQFLEASQNLKQTLEKKKPGR